MLVLQFGLAMLPSCTPVAVCQWEISNLIPPKPSPAKEVLNLVIFSTVLSLIWQAKQKYHWYKNPRVSVTQGWALRQEWACSEHGLRTSQGALQLCPAASRLQMDNFRTFSFCFLRTFFATLPIIILRSFRCMPLLRLDPLHPIIYINCSPLHPSMPLF